jgi:hypothetical protein
MLASTIVRLKSFILLMNSVPSTVADAKKTDKNINKTYFYWESLIYLFIFPFGFHQKFPFLLIKKKSHNLLPSITQP